MAETAVHPETSPPAPHDAPVKHRRWHWVLRALIVLVVLLLLVALVVQIVLWTDLPRGIVVKQVEQQLGLRMSAKSLSTGWLGHTTLSDVSLALPLAPDNKAFVSVPTMKVKNTSLFGLLIGRPVAVQAIEMDRPHLSVFQEPSGRWNLQEVAELLVRAGGKKSGQESAQTSSTPTLPKIHIAGAIVTVIDNKGRHTDVQPINVDGFPDTPVWKYEVKVEQRVSITGRVAPGGTWSHEVSINAHDVGVWAQPWMADFPATAVDVDWRGSLLPGGVGGRLDIHKATVGLKTGTLETYGAVAVATGVDGATVSLRPDNLLVKTGQKALPEFKVAAGVLSYVGASSEVKAEQLLLNVFGGPASVSASYGLNTKAGRVDARWNQLALPGKITHSGHFAAAVRQPFPNQVVLDGELTSDGNTPSGPWIATANFNASGASFTDIDWSVKTGKLEWKRRGEGVLLDGLALAGGIHPVDPQAPGPGGAPPTGGASATPQPASGPATAPAAQPLLVTIRNISLPNPDLLMGSASYRLDNTIQPWRADLRGQHWPFHPIEGTEMAFELHAFGDRKRAVLTDFQLKSPDVVVKANGTYTYEQPKPLDANVTIVNAPPAATPVALASSPQAKVVNGTVSGRASLTGTVTPLDLAVRGHLDGREIDIRGHHLGDISLLLSDQSRVNGDGAFLFTEKLKLLGGDWGLEGIYVFDTNGLNVGVDVAALDLKQVAVLADQTGIIGTMDGHVSVFAPGLSFDPNHIVVQPSTTFAIRNLDAKGVQVDEIAGRVTLSQGNLQVAPLTLKRGEGRGDVHVGLNVKDLHRINVGTTIAAWPIDVPGVETHADAWVGIPDAMILLPDAKSIDPNAKKIRVSAPRVDVRAATSLKGQALGEIVAHAGVEGRTLDLRSLTMRLLGGRMDGQAIVNADKLTGAKAEFTWEKLDFQKVALIFPGLKDLSGTMTGNLRLAPSNVPRPRAPLGLRLTGTIDGGHWRTVPVTDMRIVAFVGPNEDEPNSGWRFVLEDTHEDPSYIHLAGGTVELWGRIGTHARGTSSSSQAQLTFRDLDLDPIARALTPTSPPRPGKIAGSLTLLRAAQPPRPPATLPAQKMFPGPPTTMPAPATMPAPGSSPLQQFIEPLYGEGRIQLTETNLVTVPGISDIYNAMNAFQKANVPEGRGGAEFHLERGNVSIERFRYFNRGTEARAIASVDRIWEMPDSPVHATIFGTAEPLKKVKLPVLADFGDVLSALQKSLKLTAVNVEGTVNKPQVSAPLAITEVGAEVQRFLVGDARNNAGPAPGE